MGNATATIIPIAGFNVQIKQQLGEGGYAYVYLVEDVNNGQQFALKRILAQSEEQKRLSAQEVAVMKRLTHPNIVKFHGAVKRQLENAIEYFVLMDLCPGGSLADVIMKRSGRKIPEKQVVDIMLQCSVGIQYLHSQSPPIAHRDLKLENLLLGQDRKWKLVDFGSCTTRAQVYKTKDEIALEEERIQKFTTSMYRAPEMADLHTHQLVNEKVDVWALGCILFTLIFLEHPFQEGGTLQIISGRYHMPEPEERECSNYAVNVIKKCLTVNPKKRPDIEQLIQMLQEWQVYLQNGKITTLGESNEDNEDGVPEKKEKKSAKPSTPSSKKAAPKKPAAAKPASSDSDDFDGNWQSAKESTDDWDPFGTKPEKSKPAPSPSSPSSSPVSSMPKKAEQKAAWNTSMIAPIAPPPSSKRNKSKKDKSPREDSESESEEEEAPKKPAPKPVKASTSKPQSAKAGVDEFDKVDWDNFEADTRHSRQPSFSNTSFDDPFGAPTPETRTPQGSSRGNKPPKVENVQPHAAPTSNRGNKQHQRTASQNLPSSFESLRVTAPNSSEADVIGLGEFTAANRNRNPQLSDFFQIPAPSPNALPQSNSRQNLTLTAAGRSISGPPAMTSPSSRPIDPFKQESWSPAAAYSAQSPFGFQMGGGSPYPYPVQYAAPLSNSRNQAPSSNRGNKPNNSNDPFSMDPFS